MAVTVYKVFFEDTTTGLGRTGLTPVWQSLNYVTAGTVVAAAAQPAFTAIGNGWYKCSWDPIASGEVAGVVDGGASIATTDRYVEMALELSAAERADLAVQLAHNTKVTPLTAVGTETISDRAGTGTLTSYARTSAGGNYTRTPNGSL